MTRSDVETITRLLREARAGQKGAAEALLPLVYDQLRGLAGAHFAREASGHTLQPTALVHEAWLRFAGHLDGLEDRQHFFALASRAMRQVLTDHGRGARRQKRGDGARRVTLQGELGEPAEAGLDLLEFADLLAKLEELHPRHARVVELRVLGGLTIDEAAEVLGVSHGTIEADWFTARAWLRTKLKPA